MTIRQRDDSIKSGKGIDEGLGQNFSRRHRRSPWSNGEKDGYDPESQMPTADKNRDIQFMWSTRDIMADVEENQDTVDTPHNAITAGVNRSQSK